MQARNQTAVKPLLFCFSHLPWRFVTQRPQHLLNRAAQAYQVIYWEEPIYGEQGTTPRLKVDPAVGGVTVVRPILPKNCDEAQRDTAQRRLLDDYLVHLDKPVSVAWFYTPMAMGFAANMRCETVIYDCMDELAAFAGASPRLVLLERRLMRHADIVFTGGRSLQRAKQPMHSNVHCFPSAVDIGHYVQARRHTSAEQFDQVAIPRPRIGFFGVLDERLDKNLVEALADRRPDWQFVFIGPTAKIDVNDLPRRPNLHFLGPKPYAELPSYLAYWDAGLMPFALNEATRFISPTKTPEFLAAGVPLVSTPIADVVTSWSDVVSIAAGPEAVEAALQHVLERPHEAWLIQVDFALAGISWDDSWSAMLKLIENHTANTTRAMAGD